MKQRSSNWEPGSICPAGHAVEAWRGLGTFALVLDRCSRAAGYHGEPRGDRAARPGLK